MTTIIKLKNSVTTTNAPSSLQQGEVAINVTDRKVWVGNAATTPVQLLGDGSTGSFTSLSVSGVATFSAGSVSAPAITTTGDTNTGIFFPAADTIAFTEGGVEGMRIDSNGDLTVGRTTPLASASSSRKQIGVNGSSDSLFALGVNGTYTGVMFASASQVLMGSFANLPLLLATNNTERMRITAEGDVVVGATTSPFSNKLAVIATPPANTPVFGAYGTGNSSTSGIGIYNDTTNFGVWALNNALTFRSAALLNAGIEIMRLTDLGNVGIGTNNPTQKLDVRGQIGSFTSQSGAYNTLIIENSNSGGYAQTQYQVGASGANGTATVSYAPGIFFAMGPAAADTTTPIVFRNNNATERMRIPAAGGLQVVNSISVGNATPTTSGAGITFPATQQASSNANTLDDYEEGDVTIQFADAASGGNAYNVSARYIKIGRMVFMNWSAYYQSTPTWTAGNDIFVRGLPFATNSEGSAGAIMLRYSGSNNTGVYLWQPNSQTYFVLKYMDFDNGVKGSNMPSSLSTYANICYLTAN